MSGERELVLANIRAAIRARTQTAAKPAAVTGHRSDRLEDYAAIPRAYQRAGSRDRRERLALLTERLQDYGVDVHQVSAAEVAPALAACFTARKTHRIAVPAGLPQEWLPPGFAFVEADVLSSAELNNLDGVVTGCTVAIAETGTMVLQTGPAQGPRRLSLIPDYHVCVVLESQIVETVPEGFAHLESTATLPTTFISGPSATSDIEMTRIRGVHGPRTLEVIVAIGAGK